MLELWSSSFPGCEPIAHLLRTQLPQRWVRFHSLPESKRYPEHASEFETVLQRHEAVLNALAAPSKPLVLLTTEFSCVSTPSHPPAQFVHAGFWRSVSVEGAWWHVYAEELNWKPGLFDPLIRRASDNEIGNLMICDASCEWILHPYDGGMDVILSSGRFRDQLKAEFRDWLSRHESGL